MLVCLYSICANIMAGSLQERRYYPVMSRCLGGKLQGYIYRPGCPRAHLLSSWSEILISVTCHEQVTCTHHTGRTTWLSQLYIVYTYYYIYSLYFCVASVYNKYTKLQSASLWVLPSFNYHKISMSSTPINSMTLTLK